MRHARILLRRHWLVVIPFLVLGVVVRAWFAPGLIAGGDWETPPFTSFAQLDHSVFWPTSFDATRSTGYTMSAWWPSYPIWAVVGIFHRLHVPWTVLERLFWLWPCFALLILAPYRFLLRRSLTSAAAAIGALVFSLNTWTIGLIERGHIPALIAFALIPFIVDAVLDLFNDPRRRQIVTLALLVTLQVMYEVRYTFLTALVCLFVYAVLCWQEPKRYATRRVLAGGLWAMCTIAVLNLYWIVAAVLSPPELPNASTVALFIATSGELSLLNALALYYPYYHASIVYPSFQVHPVEAAFLVLPIVTAAGLLVARKRRLIWLFAAVAVASIVMVSGPVSTFGPVVTFAFQHVPGMSGFRDLTKLMSLIAFAFAAGFGFAANRAIAYCRLRSRVRAPFAFAAATAVLLALLMHDAYDPLRMQNFAATPVRPQDAAMQRFIDTAPGSGSIMLFPYNIPGLDGSLKHVVLRGADATQGMIPHGFVSLTDPSKPQTIFTLFQSEIGRRVLSEIGMEYVVVVDDPSNALYLPGFDNVQRDEAVRFFDALPWLSRYAKIGGNIIYRVRGVNGRNPAFYASCPISFIADGRTLPALDGTPFVSGNPGIVLAGDQKPNVRLAALPNSLSGVLSVGQFDPLARLQGQSGDQHLQDQLAFLRSAMADAQFGTRPYKAFAITQESMIPWQQGAANYIKSSWSASDKTSWNVRVTVAPPRLTSSVVANLSTEKRPADDPGSFGEPLLSPRSIGVHFAAGADEQSDGEWLLSPANTITVLDPFDEPIRADLELPGVFSTGRGTARALLEGGGQQSAIDALPRYLSKLPSAHLDLRGVILEPGLNRFTLSAPASDESEQNPLVANAEPVLKNLAFLPSDIQFAPLPLQRHVTGETMSFVSSPGGAPDRAARARVRLLAHLNIPLSRTPTVSFRYRLTTDVVGAYVAYGLRTMSGNIVELRSSLSGNQNLSQFDVQDNVSAAYSALEAQDAQSHEGDVAWILAHAPYPPDVSGMSLEYVDVILVKPQDEETRQATALSVSDVGLNVKASDTYGGPYLQTARRLDLRSAAVSRQSRRLFAVSRISKTADTFSMQVSYAPPARAAEPVTFQDGDVVSFELNGGRVVSGRVVSHENGVVLMQDGTNRFGVRDAAITTIQRVIPADSGDVVVRVPADFSEQTADLRLLLDVPPWLTYTMQLAVSDRDSRAIQYLAPTDERDVSEVDLPVSPKWISTEAMKSRAPAQPMSTLYDVNVPPLPVPSWTAIDLDLQSIYAQAPQLQAPRLRWIELHFRPLTADIGASAGTVSFSRFEIRQGMMEHPAVLDAEPAHELQIDGKPLHFGIVRRSRDDLTLQGATAVLNSGDHTLETMGASAPDVQSALVARGRPQCMTDPGVRFNELNESEISGESAGAPGLLLGNIAYDTGWKMAAMPMSFQPSGNIFRDYWAARGYFSPEALHYVVNGDLNGWWTTKTNARVLMIFVPTLVEYVAAAIWIAGLLAFGVLVLPRMPE